MSDTGYRQQSGTNDSEYERREHKPFRMPRPDALSVLLFAGWVLGVLISTIVPFLIVPPTASNPDSARVGLAFAASMVGIGIFVLSGLGMWRHLKSQAVLVFALVPAVSIGSGAIILTATLLAL